MRMMKASKTNSVLQEPDTGDLNPALQEPDTVEANSILQELDAEIAACREELTDRVSTEKEVVFLPYKASMWDALEFAWRKKAAEPGCTALVIPIPYYDRNADTTLGERHYEINEFPADVPVISCEDYDFAGRHPDAIYIHNPYDEYNRVTCVDPRFFSRKLKQYTDELVYIPYFVLPEPNLSDEEQMKYIANFAWLPAGPTAGLGCENRRYRQPENRQGEIPEAGGLHPAGSLGGAHSKA